MDHREPEMDGSRPTRSGRSTRRIRAVRGLAALLGISALLSGCVPSFEEGEPDEPATVGRRVAEVRMTDGHDRETLQQLDQVTPKAFAGAEDFERWRALIAAEFARDASGTPEGLKSLEVDDATEVVIVDVYDACDAFQVFVAAEAAVVVSRIVDPTPEGQHVCYAPELSLVISVVGLEEIGAGSPEDVVVR